jgi:hypothetical protein
MAVDPYAPPQAELASKAEPGKKSFALRTSIVLSVAGVAAFWIPGIATFVNLERASPMIDSLLGVGAIASLSFHLVGISVVFAAPRGRRIGGVLANVVPLAILAALMVLGTAVQNKA